MKLSKKLNRRVGDREYHKWVVEIPPKIVEDLGWEAGTELDAIVSGDQIILRPLQDDGAPQKSKL